MAGGPEQPAYGIFQWRDLNGNNDYDDGEVDRDPNGPDFVETAGAEFEARHQRAW